MKSNLVFGNYVTNATFCLKLGKTEIATLTRMQDGGVVRDNTDPAIWSLQSKGLVELNSKQVLVLTEVGMLVINLLVISNIIKQ